LELVWGRTTFGHALDVGCGSGVSTTALAGFATRRTGVEPVEAMCRLAPSVAPAAQFCVGTAENLPFGDRKFNCITAARSLNYADIDRFFPEAARVLAPGGQILIYDFTPGRNFDTGAELLSAWFDSFIARFPDPVGDAQELNPAILATRSRARFRMLRSLEFAVPVEMTETSYLEYALTETNVAGRDEARDWCSETLRPVWEGREAVPVVFRGYAAQLGLPG